MERARGICPDLKWTTVPIGTCPDLKWNLNENLRNFYELDFDINSLKISRTLDFDEILLA
jgi:hypothetical protein